MKNRSKITTIKIKTQPETSYHVARQRAMERIPISPHDLSMVGWYDRRLSTGGPMEVGGGQPFKVIGDYAKALGAEYEVRTGRYDFFFRTVPEDAAQLDPWAVVEIHRGLELDRFENVQGG